MNKWLETVKPLVYESRIKVPYTWSVGEVGSRFLIALRDHKKIYGTRCAKCDRVYLPPRKTCGNCFSTLHEWVEVGPKGTLITYTTVHYTSSVMPMKPSFAYGIILLDKASTGLVHLLGEVNLEEIKPEMRVEAVFKDERIGDILDIRYFKPIK
ncbi:MAG: Zn-ribbon domain-containing OB-fold protein [Deltaproteobacteria bacterium]|nr:Zn-ribbon domain-containing OB-fold protein [Deltaproteobacteria bacterium]